MINLETSPATLAGKLRTVLLMLLIVVATSAVLMIIKLTSHVLSL